jgi:hypothetical protein
MDKSVSGTEPGQRQLNGVQTTGRQYRNLSEPKYAIARDNDVPVPMRDGINLLADVWRPNAPGRFPILIAASPYPRQIQDLGAPMGFIEAGASDFFVPRGYVHVIVNLRGTGGSGGTFGFFDGQERQDMYDLIEWVAQQSWSDGNVGMVGISYFAMTQLETAVERPPGGPNSLKSWRSKSSFCKTQPTSGPSSEWPRWTARSSRWSGSSGSNLGGRLIPPARS